MRGNIASDCVHLPLWETFFSKSSDQILCSHTNIDNNSGSQPVGGKGLTSGTTDHLTSQIKMDSRNSKGQKLLQYLLQCNKHMPTGRKTYCVNVNNYCMNVRHLYTKSCLIISPQTATDILITSTSDTLSPAVSAPLVQVCLRLRTFPSDE